MFDKFLKRVQYCSMMLLNKTCCINKSCQRIPKMFIEYSSKHGAMVKHVLDRKPVSLLKVTAGLFSVDDWGFFLEKWSVNLLYFALGFLKKSSLKRVFKIPREWRKSYQLANTLLFSKFPSCRFCKNNSWSTDFTP